MKKLILASTIFIFLAAESPDLLTLVREYNKLTDQFTAVSEKYNASADKLNAFRVSSDPIKEKATNANIAFNNWKNMFLLYASYKDDLENTLQKYKLNCGSSKESNDPKRTYYCGRLREHISDRQIVVQHSLCPSCQFTQEGPRLKKIKEMYDKQKSELNLEYAALIEKHNEYARQRNDVVVKLRESYSAIKSACVSLAITREKVSKEHACFNDELANFVNSLEILSEDRRSSGF